MNSRMKKQIAYAKKNNIPIQDVWRMHEVAKKHADMMEQEATARAFLAQLALPLNLLVHDYWSKTAKRRAPKFISDLLSLNDSWIRGVVTDKELDDLLFDFTGKRMADIIDCGVVYRTFEVTNYHKFDDHEEGGCRKCGTMLANYGDTNFCPKCGTRLNWVV